MVTLAPLVSHPYTIWAVVAGLVIWASVSLFWLWRKTARLTKTLESCTALLKQSHDAVEFAGRYEAVNAELEGDEILGSRWRELREALILPRRPDTPVRSTVRPSNWFNLDLLRAPGIGLDARYHAAMPSLLVGAGLLFTFLGLAVALSSASGVVSDQVADRNTALRTLLDTASFKFLTSLTGMFLSISYALARKSRLHRIERVLDAFHSAFEQRIPLVTPVSLQMDQIAILERQATQLETFSNDLAVAIGAAIDKTFDVRLSEHVGPLTEAIQKLSANLGGQNEGAIQTMLNDFIKRLEGGTGDHMGEVVKSLGGLGARLEGLQNGLSEAAMRMAQAADSMATRMGEGAEAALARITNQMGGVAESLRLVAEQTQNAGAETTQAMAEQMVAASASFQQVADRVAGILSDAAAAMERRMGEAAGESSARLTSQFQAMLTELRTLAESSRSAGADAFSALAAQVGAAAAKFEGTAAQVATALETAATSTGGTFGKGAEDAVSRVAAATEAMREEIRLMLAEMRSSVGQAGEAMRDGSKQSAEAMRTTLDGAAGALTAAIAETSRQLVTAGGEAGSALRQGGERASERIVQAGDTFGERASGLASQIGLIATATERLAERATEFEAAARAASEPLVASAGDLRAAGQAARSAVEPLNQMAGTIGRAIEQVLGTAQRLEAAGAAAIKLTGSLDEASKRFDGVDRELASTLTGLQDGLKGFTKQIAEFVGQTDQNLARAATQLGAAVKGLESALEDYAPAAAAEQR